MQEKVWTGSVETTLCDAAHAVSTEQFVQLAVHSYRDVFPDMCILLTAPSSGLWSCNQMQPRYTDTYHFISGPVQILTDVDGHPVIPYLPASSAYCTKYRECTAALDQAPFFTCSHVQKTEALYNPNIVASIFLSIYPHRTPI